MHDIEAAKKIVQDAISEIHSLRSEAVRLDRCLTACHAESVERWRLLLEASTDAKRYRWLRDSQLGWRLLKFSEPSQVGTAIDAAMKDEVP